MWKSCFIMGWKNTGAVLAAFLGGAAAVFLAISVLAVVLLVLVVVLDVLFDRITEAMAKRWEKNGKKPAYRWAEIIAKWNHNE